MWAMTAPTQLQRLSGSWTSMIFILVVIALFLDYFKIIVVIPRVIYVNIYPSRGNLTRTEEAAVQLVRFNKDFNFITSAILNALIYKGRSESSKRASARSVVSQSLRDFPLGKKVSTQ